MEVFTNNQEYLTKMKCPICHYTIKQSDYLASVFADDQQALWLANLVTHYRHNHINWWNKCWGKNGSYYLDSFPFGDYDQEKKKVNESAKRQLIRKGSKIMFDNGITPDTFRKLECVDPDTLKVVDKYYKRYNDEKSGITKVKPQRKKQVKLNDETAVYTSTAA